MAKLAKGGTTFSNSHAAVAESGAGSDAQMNSGPISLTLTGDPGSAALYSLGTTNTTMTTLPTGTSGNVTVPTDLLSSTVGVPEYSDLGATITITDGTHIGYDMSSMSPAEQLVIDDLGVNDTIADKFYYAIKMADGTVSYNTYTVTIHGSAAIVVAQDSGVVEDVAVSSGNLTDTIDVDAKAASGNDTSFTITSDAGNLGSLDATTGSGDTKFTYTVSNSDVYSTHLGYGEYRDDGFTVETTNHTKLHVTEEIDGNIHAADKTEFKWDHNTATVGDSVAIKVDFSDHDDNAHLSAKITGVPMADGLLYHDTTDHTLTANGDGSYSLDATELAALHDGSATLSLLANEADASLTITIDVKNVESYTDSHSAAQAGPDGSGIPTVATLDTHDNGDGTFTHTATTDTIATTGGLTVTAPADTPVVSGDDVWVATNATKFDIPASWVTAHVTDSESFWVTNVTGLPGGATAHYDGSGHLTDISVDAVGQGNLTLGYTVTNSDGNTANGTIDLDAIQQPSNGDTLDLTKLTSPYDNYDYAYIAVGNGANGSTLDAGSGTTYVESDKAQNTFMADGSAPINFVYQQADWSEIAYHSNDGSVQSNSIDTISGFLSGTDKIDLSAVVDHAGDYINAYAGNLGSTTTIAAHSVGWLVDGSGNVDVFANETGSAENITESTTVQKEAYSADMEIHLTGISSLASGDFILHA